MCALCVYKCWGVCVLPCVGFSDACVIMTKYNIIHMHICHCCSIFTIHLFLMSYF